MCGIAGIWHLNNSKLSESKLKSFTDSLAHRGPDGAGYYIDNSSQLGLGHRRLSILDLSNAAKQPMAFADGRYQITYNGEIYNFIELRQQLTKVGYSFKTESDTEVLLSAYHYWGKECMQYFNGMFAFAIWDSVDKELFLCRDRFGVKPLFYHFDKAELFAFASETIAFKSLENFKRVASVNSVILGISHPEKIEPYGNTIFDNLKQIPAGCYAILKRDTEFKLVRWWNLFESRIKVSKRYSDHVEHFKELFGDACKLRLRSDVPVASALSGGVDSSSVYCMINHLMKNSKDKTRIPEDWQQAFVGTFPGSELDEKKFADVVLNYSKGKATYVVPTQTHIVDELISSTLLFDSITGTPINAVSNIYKAMRNGGITVSLDGHGADELMFGYRASVAEAYLDAYQSGKANSKDLKETFANMFELQDRKSAVSRLEQRALMESRGSLFSKTKGVIKSFFPKALNSIPFIELYTDTWFNKRNIILSKPPQYAIPQWPKVGRTEERLFADFSINHIPYNLRDFDRASMQNGIEIRMPFMDYRLVSYLFSLPVESKLGGGFTKRLLRDAMSGIMPETIRTRTTKLGLTAPIAEWFNQSMNEFILDTVNSTEFIQSQYWNGMIIKEFAESRTISKSWNTEEAGRFWKILNAHIILSNN